MHMYAHVAGVMGFAKLSASLATLPHLSWSSPWDANCQIEMTCTTQHPCLILLYPQGTSFVLRTSRSPSSSTSQPHNVHSLQLQQESLPCHKLDPPHFQVFLVIDLTKSTRYYDFNTEVPTRGNWCPERQSYPDAIMYCKVLTCNCGSAVFFVP